MCVCLRVCTVYTYACVHVYVCMYIYKNICVCVLVCVCVYINIFMCVSACVHVLVCVYKYMCVCVCMCTNPAQRGAAAGSRSADTSPQGRGQVTCSPPTGRTRPPSRQSGSAAGGGRCGSPWRRTPGAAPSGPQPPASCPRGSRGWEPPWGVTAGGTQSLGPPSRPPPAPLTPPPSIPPTSGLCWLVVKGLFFFFGFVIIISFLS